MKRMLVIKVPRSYYRFQSRWQKCDYSRKGEKQSTAIILLQFDSWWNMIKLTGKKTKRGMRGEELISKISKKHLDDMTYQRQA